MVKLIKKYNDDIGYISSTLCLIHCLLTPFFFAIQCCSFESNLTWWGSLDWVFITISFFAVQQTIKTSTIKFVRYSLGFIWFFLIIGTVLKTLGVCIPAYMTNTLAFLLAIIHIYNKKYCKCSTGCCS